jgi:hypothetical protein
MKNDLLVKNDLAINGGKKTVTRSFVWPVFDESDVQAVTEVARSGQWGNPDCKGLVENLKMNSPTTAVLNTLSHVLTGRCLCGLHLSLLV